MNEQPLISIVIPAFNPRFFEMALASALAQSHDSLEVLVCDDSGGDEIEAIVRSFELKGHGKTLRYLRNPQPLGFPANILQAVAAARGELVKVLCDDDRLMPLCIERQAQVLEAHAEVSLVLSQRMFADSDNYILPMRLANARFANVDSLFKGDDILSVLAGRELHFLGNFSSALMRREQALEFLRALTGEQAAFSALLDEMLFICLMRRGELAMLTDVLAIERLYPERLRNQTHLKAQAATEWSWIQQMLAQRAGDPAVASGWVRLIPLEQAQLPVRPWQEVNLVLQLGNWQATMLGRVGSDTESYDALYRQWLEVRKFSAAQRRALSKTLAAWPARPRIVTVIVDPDGDREGLEQTLASLQAQLYPGHHCVVLSDSPVESPLSMSQLPLQADWPTVLGPIIEGLPDNQWIYLLRAGDRLAVSALLVLAERIAVLPGLACIYSDEGAWREGHGQQPVFKPDFNIDLMRSFPYVGRALAFNAEMLKALGGFDAAFGELAPHDALWRLVETHGPQAIGHIAEVQLQSTLSFEQWLSLDSVARHSAGVVSAHLDRLGITHRLQHTTVGALNRVEYLHEQQPWVSLIVQCSGELADLQRCVMSVIEHTAYANYELLLVAAESVDPGMRGWLQAMAEVGGDTLRVLLVDEQASAESTNQAAAQARGDYVLMLSAGLEVRDSNWLAEMLQHALRPEVAVVGARVLDAQQRIVHAGLVLGVEALAGRVYGGESAQASGYLQRLQVVQNWSVLSADCLLVRKSVFDAVGGLDAGQLDRELGVLDVCLKAREAGYLAVWTPFATLHTQLPAGPSPGAVSPESQRNRFRERWLPVIASDPAYNPNLGLHSANFSLDPGLRHGWNPLCARALPSVLALPVNATAVGHYRVIQPCLELEAAGLAVGRIVYEVPGIVPLARMEPDVVVLQLRHSHESAAEIERIARFSNARRIFEIDDYILDTPKKNIHAHNTPADIEQQLRRSVGLCDRVVTTTETLADALSSMHRDIRVVPNKLAAHLWLGLQSRRATSTKPRVGWGGGTSHGGDLEIIAEVVRELADQVEWVFFGMCPESLKPYIHEFHAVVGLLAYPAKLASLNLDLALAPLELHIFNDCKSNLRLLEYGACGYPVICSDTHAYRGDLPCTRVRSNSSAEWLEAIRMHLADPHASYRMGDELRAAVLRDHVLRGDHLQQWVRGWLAD